MIFPEWFKKTLRTTLPPSAWDYIYKIRVKLKLKKFKSMTLEQTFDEVYTRGYWAPNKTEMLSGPGSYGDVAEKYVNFIKKFINDKKVNTITDIGCGDFNIGNQLCSLVSEYNALDVSENIIERNKAIFKNRKNVHFQKCNACIDPIPCADLITIREVLQHLTNAQIEAILKNVENSKAKYLLVAGISISREKMTAPNIDLYSHGHETRTIENSGVVITEPPYSRKASLIMDFIVNRREKENHFYVWLISLTSG